MGIANIINTSTSSGGGGGEIIRELVNSSDGQGLYFSNTGYIHLANNAAAEFGTSDFSIEFILNQTGEVGSSGGSIYQSATTVNNKFSIENHVSSNVVKLIFFNAVGAAAQYDLSYNMAADYNEPTHYVVSCDRSGNAVLYRNGTEVASVSIAASASTNLGDGVTSTAMIGNSGSGYTFLGGLYRFRTWNKALTHDEVDTCFQRADVPFVDQYGSETSLVDANASTFVGTSTYGWVKYGNNTIANTSNQLVITYVDNVEGAYNYLKNSTDLTTDLTVGKKYKIKIDAKYAGGSAGVKLKIHDGASNTEFGTLTTSLTTYEVEFTAQSTSGAYIKLGDMSASNVVTLDNFYVYTCGVLTDHDLAFANPTQSAMCQDRANKSDGTMGGTIQQTQKIVQLNAVAARVSTSTAYSPADGVLATDKIQNVRAAGQTLEIGQDANSHYISTVGANRTLNISASGTLDWHDLKIDSNGHIGLSCTANFASANNNNTILSLKGKAAAYGSNIELSNYGTSGNDQTLGSIGYFDPTTAVTKNAEIKVLRESADDDAKMVFKTKPTGGTIAARMTISSAGNVTQAGGVFQKTGTNGNVTIDAAGQTIDLSRNGGNYLFANGGASASLQIQGQHSLQFSTGASQTEQMRISSAGMTTVGPTHGAITFNNTSSVSGSTVIQQTYSGSNPELRIGSNVSTGATSAINVRSGDAGLVTINGGINFTQTNTAATGASTTAAILNHYEEGTWSPQFNAATPFTSTPAMEILSAVYTRIGNLVYIQAYIRTDNVDATGGSGQLRINGLPFVCASSQKYGTISIGSAGSFVSNKFPSGGHIVTGTSYITLTKRPSAGGSLLTCDLDSLTTGVTANQNSLLFSGTYTV